jgi:hypothetical protein
VAIDQDGAGQVLLVTLDDRSGNHVVTIEPRRVGQTRAEKLELDVSGIRSQPDLIEAVGRHADPNLVLDVRLTGLYPDELDLDLDEIERALSPSFLRFRMRDMSIPGTPDGVPPPPDTVVGAFLKIVQDRMAEIEAGSAADGRTESPLATTSLDPAEELADLREVLRLGRHLLEGRQVTL